MLELESRLILEKIIAQVKINTFHTLIMLISFISLKYCFLRMEI